MYGITDGIFCSRYSSFSRTFFDSPSGVDFFSESFEALFLNRAFFSKISRQTFNLSIFLQTNSNFVQWLHRNSQLETRFHQHSLLEAVISDCFLFRLALVSTYSIWRSKLTEPCLPTNCNSGSLWQLYFNRWMTAGQRRYAENTTTPYHLQLWVIMAVIFQLLNDCWSETIRRGRSPHQTATLGHYGSYISTVEWLLVRDDTQRRRTQSLSKNADILTEVRYNRDWNNSLPSAATQSSY